MKKSAWKNYVFFILISEAVCLFPLQTYRGYIIIKNTAMKAIKPFVLLPDCVNFTIEVI